MNEICQRLRSMNLNGNVTPVQWYKAIRRSSGKPDPIAVAILADIIYWYRPIEIRDERTGEVVEWRQKFRSDKLQKSYKEYSNLFGFSKKQVKNAIDNLVDQNLITREFRDIQSDSGHLTNVMYLEPVLENVSKITHSAPQNCEEVVTKKEPPSSQNWEDPPPKKGTPPSKIGNTSFQNWEDLPPKLGTPPSKIGRTYTKTTTEITTEKEKEDPSSDFCQNPSSSFPSKESSDIPFKDPTTEPASASPKESPDIPVEDQPSEPAANPPKEPPEIPLEDQMEALLARYAPKQRQIIDECIACLCVTRKSGKIQNSVLLAQFEKWDKLDADRVMYGIREYLDKEHYLNGRKEDYLFGIMKNARPPAKARESPKTGTQQELPFGNVEAFETCQEWLAEKNGGAQ